MMTPTTLKWNVQFHSSYDVPAAIDEDDRFEDQSWHLDGNPQFKIAEKSEWLCVDHPEPSRRRDPRAMRYTVLKDDNGCAGNELVLQTDDLDEVMEHFNKQ